MKVEIFVYDQTYSACIDDGCDVSLAKETAQSAVLKYRRNEFNGKVSKLIKQAATNAKKLIVKKRNK